MTFRGWEFGTLTHKPETSAWFQYIEAHMGFGLRAYADGVSYIAQTLLPGPSDVQGIRKDGKRAEFLRWYNQDDQSLVEVDKSTMIANLGSRVTNIENWDSHGVKFVFRALSGTSASFSPLRGTASSRQISIAPFTFMCFPTHLSACPTSASGLSSGNFCRPHQPDAFPKVDEPESYITNVDEFDEASTTVFCQLCIPPMNEPDRMRWGKTVSRISTSSRKPT